MAYAGGEAALAAAPALEWKGSAAVHLPDRDIRLYGHWRVLPPDSAIVATFEVSKGPGTTRRLILAGRRGWLQRDSTLTPMPPELVAEERHQFYLYALLRLLPLQRARLLAVPADSSGAQGLRVDQPGRLPVFVYFAPSGQVTRLATRFATSDGTPGDSQDVYLSGLTEAGGVRWFRRMSIHRNGAPFFDLEVDTLQALPALRDPLLAGSRPSD